LKDIAYSPIGNFTIFVNYFYVSQTFYAVSMPYRKKAFVKTFVKLS